MSAAGLLGLFLGSIWPMINQKGCLIFTSSQWFSPRNVPFGRLDDGFRLGTLPLDVWTMVFASERSLWTFGRATVNINTALAPFPF